ncbi:hypothetical protein SESBI_37285 [Sesbania bispinosa]|nr:hypothetical protein SESBI_37285 [Sesbania bispinosa]
MLLVVIFCYSFDLPVSSCFFLVSLVLWFDSALILFASIWPLGVALYLSIFLFCYYWAVLGKALVLRSAVRVLVGGWMAMSIK